MSNSASQKKNILITCAGGGGPIFLARELGKSHNVFLVDGGDQNAGPHLGFPFQKIPFGNSPEFSKAIKNLVEKWKIDCLVPGADEELLPVAKILEENPKLMGTVPSADFISLCLNKKRLMEELSKDGISNLLGFKEKKDVVYPAIIKPIFGRGSRQFHIIKNADEMEGYLKLYGEKFEDVLCQPYIEGVEYTVSVIVNNKNKLIGIVPKRIIEKRGITRSAVSEYSQIINDVSRAIVEKYNPKGLFNIQLKIFKGVVYIFEINPRLSTTSVLTDKSFGNEVELYMKYYDEETIINPPKLKEKIFLYRYDENIFV